VELQQPREPRLRHHPAFKGCGLRLFLVGYESGNRRHPRPHQEGVTLEEMRRFTKDCHRPACHSRHVHSGCRGIESKPSEQTPSTLRKNRTSSACRCPGRADPARTLRKAKLQRLVVKKDKTDLTVETRRLSAKARRISGVVQGGNLRGVTASTAPTISPETDSAHHQEPCGDKEFACAACASYNFSSPWPASQDLKAAKAGARVASSPAAIRTKLLLALKHQRPSSSLVKIWDFYLCSAVIGHCFLSFPQAPGRIMSPHS